MRKFLPISVLLLIILTGCTSANSEIILSDNVQEEAPIQEEPEEISESCDITEEEVIETLVVYVCGAVKEPGVYELPGGSRIDDAVLAAGGFTDEADKTYVNLAARISDGSKLHIPTIEETMNDAVVRGIDSFVGDSSVAAATGSESGGLININTASKEQLTTLPGIGDGIAGKIIKYRDENGSFKSIEDIMKVSGIKDKLFSKIKDKITV